MEESSVEVGAHHGGVSVQSSPKAVAQHSEDIKKKYLEPENLGKSV